MHSIIGHSRIRDYLLSAISTDTLSSAYLFTGPRSVGKRVVADWFVEQMGDCEVTVVEHDGKSDTGTIKVKQARVMMDEIALTTLSGGRRVVIIDGAESLNDASSNALLKNLEEPPANTLFILINHDLRGLLATLMSRCSIIRFASVPTSEIVAGLTTRGVTDPEMMAQLSYGRPGVALQDGGGSQVEDVIRNASTQSLSEQLNSLEKFESGEILVGFERFLHGRILSGAYSAQLIAQYERVRDMATRRSFSASFDWEGFFMTPV